MTEHLNKAVVLALILLSIVLTGCDNSKKQLNALLIEVADKDQTVDAADWNRIVNFLTDNKAHFKDFFHGDDLDEEEVEEYVEDFFAKRRPPKTITFANYKVKVNFYLERSGSMVPYDAAAGDGSFKAAILKMLNALPDNDNKIFVVNSEVTPYPQGVRQFVADRDIFNATKGLGDASYTDFGKIFDQVLNQTGKDELSILVTDMIYSTRDMAGINPQKVFAEAQGMTANVFKGSVKDRSLLVIKMEGSYDGPYYPYNAPQTGKEYHGKRPYYIVIAGPNKVMSRIAKSENYRSFCDFVSMRGYQNMYLFETNDIYKPYYSLLLAGDDVRGRFRPERGQDARITKIEDIKADKNSGDVQLAVAVDLSGMFIDKDYLTDKSNYEIESEDKITLKSIRPITKADQTDRERKYLGTATHIFVLHAESITRSQDVEIKLLNRLPQWVFSSNDDDDTTVEPSTTFGFKYLMQGIYDSYARNADGTPCYFDLDLELDR